jgi:hypothetical protein
MSSIPTRISHGEPSKAEQEEIDAFWKGCGTIAIVIISVIIAFVIGN